MSSVAIEDVLLLAGAKRLPQLSGQICVTGAGAVKLQLIRIARLDLRNSRRVLIQADETETVMEEVITQSGKQPFSLVLPSQSQPSLHAKLDDPLGIQCSVNIEYVLSVLHIKTQTELVRRPVPLNFAKQHGMPINICEETRVSSRFWCCVEDPTSHVLTLVTADTDTACAGGSWEIFAELYNYSRYPIDKVQVKLERTITAHATSNSEVITMKEFKGIEPGRYIPTFPISLQIPAAALPSVDVPSFSCKYYIGIKTLISHAHDVEVHIPVHVVPLTADKGTRAWKQSG